MASLEKDADGEGRTLVADSGAVALQMTLVRPASSCVPPTKLLSWLTETPLRALR